MSDVVAELCAAAVAYMWRPTEAGVESRLHDAINATNDVYDRGYADGYQMAAGRAPWPITTKGRMMDTKQIGLTKAEADLLLVALNFFRSALNEAQSRASEAHRVITRTVPARTVALEARIASLHDEEGEEEK